MESLPCIQLRVQLNTYLNQQRQFAVAAPDTHQNALWLRFEFNLIDTAKSLLTSISYSGGEGPRGACIYG